MIVNIAWRNIWRNPLRSGIVMGSVALGLGLGAFLLAFSWGLTEQRNASVLKSQTSHLQLHAQTFTEEREVERIIPNGLQIADDIAETSGVVAVAPRTLVTGMAASAKAATGIAINGVYPDRERRVTDIAERMVEGEYLSEEGRKPVIIGRALAEKLQVGLRKKIVLTFRDVNGELTSGAFRVAGIFRSGNSMFDKSQLFVRAEDLQTLLGQSDKVHELAIWMKNPQSELASLRQSLVSAHPKLRVEDWGELEPTLKLTSETFEQSMQIIIGIFLLALGFGIVNTMLMAVLERRRELGMLMSVGMNRRKVFAMVMLETAFLVMIGAPIGLLLAAGMTAFFGQTGIDLSMFQEGFERYGMSSRVYPSLPARFYLRISVMVILTALLSAIWPARRALKLVPAEAVRAI